jgi:predicted metal-dependent HD superfamily phosphohydrolase
MLTEFRELRRSMGLVSDKDTDVHGRTSEKLFEKIEEAYSSGRRRYHTLEHVAWVLKRIDEMADVDVGRGAKFDAAGWNVIRWAAWYHDFVLDGSPDDEKQSADAAVRALPEQPRGSNPHASDVYRLILATGHDRIPLRHDEAALCDADLAILGAPIEVFNEYERRVREEWAHVPDELFAPARYVILKRFMDRPWIYMTLFGRERWEQRARSNLAISMARLGSSK